MKKIILLTGSSRGIGKAIKNKLEKKYKIISPDREELNLSNDNSIDNFIKKYKKEKINIIINNAGINHPQWIDELSDENINETIQVNLIAPIKLIRGFVGSMKKDKWGRIVNISSIFGVIARGKQVLYSATKHGINGVTQSLALELAPYNILVNSVSPGFTNTDLIKVNPPEKIAAIASDIPMGRLAEPEEIANLVAFLIAEENTYITGANIVIDGGFICK
ncbi:MAG: SDR family oxidoreductase [Candidatus Levybacteria bacterium]|nr:SDR family oxidoreductase [Candidatus Levybacteria bacterium]